MSSTFTRLSFWTIILFSSSLTYLVLAIDRPIFSTTNAPSSSAGTKSLSISLTENTAVHVGEPLELSCSATHKYNSLQIYGSSHLIANSQGSVNESKWSVLKNDHHQLAIIIKVTQLSDGGTYWCQDAQSNTLSAVSTQVVVLDHSSNCLMNTSRLSVKEFEEVSMRCGTGYSGGWAPSIHWQDGNGQRITAGVSSVTNSSHVTSLLTLTASASHHGVVYSCVILFDNSSQIVKGNVWSNTPSYQHTCSLPALNISFGARNMSIYPLKNHYFIKLENSVKCSAEGNPPPTCSWFNILTSETTGDMLYITESMNETVQLYQCGCFNDIGSTTKNFSFNVTGSTSDSEGDKTGVGGGDTTVMTLGVVVGAGVLVVIFFVTLLVLSKRFKKGASAERKLEHTQYTHLDKVSHAGQVEPVYAILTTDDYQDVTPYNNSIRQPQAVQRSSDPYSHIQPKSATGINVPVYEDLRL